ncbi:hypothetical protein DFJ73DRAFT_945562 [Zopfochytrium polystomum]|nr:hypothetical protein DFJ73DRAFT_945562 [Zopfochytrium polystomum]
MRPRSEVGKGRGKPFLKVIPKEGGNISPGCIDNACFRCSSKNELARQEPRHARTTCQGSCPPTTTHPRTRPNWVIAPAVREVFVNMPSLLIQTGCKRKKEKGEGREDEGEEEGGEEATDFRTNGCDVSWPCKGKIPRSWRALRVGRRERVCVCEVRRGEGKGRDWGVVWLDEKLGRDGTGPAKNKQANEKRKSKRTGIGNEAEAKEADAPATEKPRQRERERETERERDETKMIQRQNLLTLAKDLTERSWVQWVGGGQNAGPSPCTTFSKLPSNRTLQCDGSSERQGMES